MQCKAKRCDFLCIKCSCNVAVSICRVKFYAIYGNSLSIFFFLFLFTLAWICSTYAAQLTLLYMRLYCSTSNSNTAHFSIAWSIEQRRVVSQVRGQIYSKARRYMRLIHHRLRVFESKNPFVEASYIVAALA